MLIKLSECPLCSSNDISKYCLPFSGLTHSTFELIDSRNHLDLSQCNCCSHIFKDSSIEKTKTINDLLKSPRYAHNDCKSDILQKKISVQSYRQSRQIQEISKILSANTFSRGLFLDFGCNKGELLNAIYNSLPSSFSGYVGLDVVLRDESFSLKDYISFTTNLSSLPDKSISCVVFSHSIFYVDSLHDLFAVLNRKMRHDGFLLIESPNPKRNSIYLLDDQFHFFQPKSLCNLLDIYGYKSAIHEDMDSNRDLLVVASRLHLQLSDVWSYHDDKPYDSNNVMDIINFFEELKQKLVKFSGNSEIAVLGRTSSAALICQILDSQITIIIDEQSVSSSDTFFGHPVISSFDNLSEGTRLIIPMFHLNKDLAARLHLLSSKIPTLAVQC